MLASLDRKYRVKLFVGSTDVKLSNVFFNSRSRTVLESSEQEDFKTVLNLKIDEEFDQETL